MQASHIYTASLEPVTYTLLLMLMSLDADMAWMDAQTLMLSVTVGVACSFYPSVVVLEALGLTAAIVVGLTGWTFHAIRQGKDLSVMGPFLFAGRPSRSANCGSCATPVLADIADLRIGVSRRTACCSCARKHLASRLPLTCWSAGLVAAIC